LRCRGLTRRSDSWYSFRGDIRARRTGAIMTTLHVQLTLPDHLAQEVEAIGLLKPEALERLLREEIRRRHAGHLLEKADRRGAGDWPPLTEAEVEAEIRAARRERRGGHAGRS